MPRWNTGQTKLANLSTRSTRVIADGSHLIAWEHPDLVARAIECVLGQAANRTRGAAVAQQIPSCRITDAFQYASR
jgi:hypothetical protein